MANFTIETSLPFPFLELNELVSSTEVKKPTGISYMLLVLIKESFDKNVYLASLLESFGIPKNLHGIYADELLKLINEEIIEYNNGDYNYNKFNDCKISDFKFTAFGNKVFAEEQISFGKIKESKINCYYDIALDQLSLNPNQDLEVKPLKNTVFDKEFILKFKCNKDVESFFTLNKGPSFKVKAEEVITKVELQSTQAFVGKYNVKFEINNDNLNIKLENKLVQDFFDTYYTADYVNNAIALKNKFKFNTFHDAKLSDFEEKDIFKILLPSEFNQVLSVKYPLVLTRNDYETNEQSVIIKDSNIVNKISKYADFVCAEGSLVYAYCPLRLELNENRLGKIYLPLLLVLNPTLDDLRLALSSYINSKTEYSYDSYKEIVHICNVIKDYDTPINILKSYMDNNKSYNIVILNEVKPILINNFNLINKYKQLLKETYIDYISSINEDSLDTALKITSKIPSFIGMPKDDVFNLIIKALDRPKDNVYEYEILSKYFNKELVLYFVNPFVDVLNNHEVNNKELIDIITFNNSLDKLKHLTGISDFAKYTFNEDELNKQEFKQTYITVANSYNNIKIFKPFNKEYFNDQEKYLNIFNLINDNLNTLELALKTPKNIKPELIEKKIISGDYQFAIINLSAKLDLILEERYGLKGNLIDKLKKAKEKDLIDEKTIDALHSLRKNRNALAHHRNRDLNIKADDIRFWSKKVFALEEDLK